MWRNLFFATLTVVMLSCGVGCSTLGLTLWPAQFPLLTKTKEFAAKSPLPSGMPHELSKQVLQDYFVEPGDRILIEPVALDSEFRLVGDQEIQLDGSIDLGEYGRIRVAGMTVEAIERAIEDHLAQFIEEREAVNVQLIETNAAEFYVLGEVGSPGAYAMDGNETVLDAIVMAGGLTNRASPCDMILVRPTNPADCRVVQRICYRQITQLGDVTSNYQLQPGDRVVVGSRTLCEELAFWKQTSACECCDRSRCVECSPASTGYANRFSGWLTSFPLPRRSPSDDDSSIAEGEEEQLDALEAREPTSPQADSQGSRPEPNGSVRPQPRPNNSDEPTVDDSDVFLPPIEPGQSQGRRGSSTPYRLEAGVSSRLGAGYSPF